MSEEAFAPVFDDKGYITAVVTHAHTKQLLMVAYMNEEALEKTRETGYAYFFSRKRQALWKKGEMSGNVLAVQKILVDCDQDCIELRAVVQGDGKACHTGATSCFYRELRGEKLFV